MSLPAAQATDTSGLPRERGGWWHDFVCPTHGVELSHEGIPGVRPPADGVGCAYGCRVGTERVRDAWLVLSHQAWARRIRVLAHRAARTGDATVRAEAVQLLVAYAEIYTEVTGGGDHEQAQDWMLRGRLFHQALTDAIWSVSIAHAVWSLAESAPEEAAALRPALVILDDAVEQSRAARDRLVAEGRFTSNYTAWLNAAGRTCARAAELVRAAAGEQPTEVAAEDEWLDGAHGQFAHLLAATTSHGWEWEATTYYHGFVLRACLLSLRGVDPSALPADAGDRLAAMIDVLGELATEGGILPALHDGPYARPALELEWTELRALADGFLADAGLDAVAAHAREAGPEGDALEDELRSMPHGWFGGPPAVIDRSTRPAVSVDTEVGVAVLRAAGIHAVLDFGPHGESHGHHDKLSLSLYGRETPWQPDPGQVPYGHPAWRAHYASADAHPCVRVGAGDPREATGRVVARDERSLTVEVVGSPTSWYDGVRAVRHVVVADGYLLDVVVAAADRPRRLILGMRPDVTFEVRTEGDLIRSSWRGVERLDGVHAARAAGPSGPVPVRATLHPGPGPADDPQRVRTHLDWAAEDATRVLWVSVLQAGSATDVAVTGIELRGSEVRVTRADRIVDVHPLPPELDHG
ncbi:heparinase II/III family protein [Microbacterium sp. NPDC057650]|uniref:heparinase II/III domain-containing protein n=1 Tax=unclassified Microbacterium TaxID=2609290 RepID=UPI00366FB4B1